jgi:hypothetical protein
MGHDRWSKVHVARAILDVGYDSSRAFALSVGGCQVRDSSEYLIPEVSFPFTKRAKLRFSRAWILAGSQTRKTGSLS